MSGGFAIVYKLLYLYLLIKLIFTIIYSMKKKLLPIITIVSALYGIAQLVMYGVFLIYPTSISPTCLKTFGAIGIFASIMVIMATRAYKSSEY